MKDIPPDVARSARTWAGFIDQDFEAEDRTVPWGAHIVAKAIAGAIMEERQTKSEKFRRIVLRLYSELERLGAKSDLLGIVGSWGDTMEDEEVLEALMKRDIGKDAPQ